MGIPDDAKLKEELRKILAGADLESFTKRAARRELETALGLEEGGLDERKKDIADWVEEYIQEKDNEIKEEEEEEEEDSQVGSDEDKKPAAKPEKKGKGGGKGWKPVWLKPALAEFVGSSEMKRTEVVKMIWDHVKENNLKDPSNGQYFICDEKLFKVFNKKRIHCFKMNKDLSKLMHPVEATSAPARKRKASSEDEGDDDNEDASDGSSAPAPKRKAAAAAAPAKKRKSGSKGGGFQAEVQLSDELSSLLGSDRMPRTQVVKSLWAYIKGHDLQDPKNKMRILPDARMRTVFGKEPFTGFSMMKLLKSHISKI